MYMCVDGNSIHFSIQWEKKREKADLGMLRFNERNLNRVLTRLVPKNQYSRTKQKAVFWPTQCKRG